MAKPIKQIQQELDHLTEQTQHFSQEIYQLYSDYLKRLSQATRQQLILAVYHICTQVYPDTFLALSYNDRQKLQANIRESSASLEQQLLSHLNNLNPNQSPLHLLESLLLSLPDAPEMDNSPLENFEPETEETEEFSCQHPDQLMLWCKHIEQGINHSLEQLSHKVNQCLQKGKIVSNTLPPKLLEMALQAEEGGMTMGSSPNILNLLVEAKSSEENDQDNEESEGKITKITAVHLRLSDIEFATPELTVMRKQIRQTLEKVNKLRQQYHQAQKDYAIAQAEAAWRASWTDEC